MDLSFGNILRQARDKYGLDPAEFAGRLGNYAKNKPTLVAPEHEEAGLSAEHKVMFSLKAKLLKQARALANEHGQQFSLEHYRKECENFSATEQGKSMVTTGKWKPAIYADLSDQNLDGIRLSDPKAIKPDQNLSPPSRKDYDSFDLDGDGQINSPPITAFYDNIRLNGASLRDAFVEPATSFNEEVAKAKQLKGLTFSGMSEGDSFTFGAGAPYQDIRLENINGGQITFNGAVDGVAISGKSASIAIGDHARVSDMQTSAGFSILHLDMGTGAIISNADLSKSTISMTSNFEAGSALQNVQLGSNLNGLDLSGVNLRNVAIDGKAIINPSQLPEGVMYDTRTTASASQEFIMQCHAKEALNAGFKDFTWNPEMQQVKAPEPAVTPAPIAQAIAPTRITGGDTVTLNDVSLSREVATNVARTQPTVGESMLVGLPSTQA